MTTAVWMSVCSGGATTMGTAMAMCPLTHKGFGEGWARMAEGSEKQESPFYPIEHRVARLLQNAVLSLRFRRLICREQPIHVVPEFALPHSTCIWPAPGASWYRWHFDRTSDDQCRSDDRACLSLQ
jgi:hypothetical protein